MCLVYSSPSPGGLCQTEATLSNVATNFWRCYCECITSPSRQRPPLRYCPNFLQNMVALLEGDYCISQKLSWLIRVPDMFNNSPLDTWMINIRLWLYLFDWFGCVCVCFQSMLQSFNYKEIEWSHRDSQSVLEVKLKGNQRGGMCIMTKQVRALGDFRGGGGGV